MPPSTDLTCASPDPGPASSLSPTVPLLLSVWYLPRGGCDCHPSNICLAMGKTSDTSAFRGFLKTPMLILSFTLIIQDAQRLMESQLFISGLWE